MEALETGRWSSLPPKSVVITVDDGHMGNRQLLGVLKELPAPPTVFLCSQIVGTNRGYWPEEFADREALKRISHSERLAILGSRGFSLDSDLPDGRRAALSVEELSDLLPWIEVGSHTRFHPTLPTCSDEVADDEIRTSRTELESMTGKECVHFCFPNGDWTGRDVQIARDSGYRSARTTDIGWVGPNSDPFRLKILGVSDTAPVAQLAADLAGLGFAKAILRRLRQLIFGAS